MKVIFQKITKPARSLIGIILRPGQEVLGINKKPEWLGQYIYLCLGKIIVERFHYSIEINVIEKAATIGLDPEKLNASIEFIKMTSLFAVLFIPAFIIVKNLFITAIIYFLSLMMGARVTFKKIFAVSIISWTVLLISRIFNLLILRLKGTENLLSLEDLNVNLGLDIILSDHGNIAMTKLLSSINIFSIWYILVMTMGVSSVTGLGRKKSFSIVMFVWVLAVSLKIAIAVLDENITSIGG